VWSQRFALGQQCPFSLAASIRFLESFTPASYPARRPARLEFAFAVDGHWDPVAAGVEQKGDAVVGWLHAAQPLAPRVVDAAVDQVRRILSLDIDGSGFPEVGRADPVVGRLQRRYPGLRPVCFWSPYEAATWAVIGQRVRIVQAAAVKARMAAELGSHLALDGHQVVAFPPPAVVMALSSFPGLGDGKIRRLNAVARAALEGRLDAGRLRAMPRDEALAGLQAIPGIGPFSAELVLLRGAGDPDHVPVADLRLRRAIAMAYGLAGPPTPDAVASLAEAWKPYRTWVSLLLRTMLEDETREIAARATRSGPREGSGLP
jgi:DNA-3-methyladenine glycosylase II